MSIDFEARIVEPLELAALWSATKRNFLALTGSRSDSLDLQVAVDTLEGGGTLAGPSNPNQTIGGPSTADYAADLSVPDVANVWLMIGHFIGPLVPDPDDPYLVTATASRSASSVVLAIAVIVAAADLGKGEVDIRFPADLVRGSPSSPAEIIGMLRVEHESDDLNTASMAVLRNSPRFANSSMTRS